MTRQRRKRWIGWALVAGVYLMVIGCAQLADRLILFPQRGPERAVGAQRQGVPFDGGEVEVWVAMSPGATGPDAPEPVAYVLKFVGNADRAERSVSDEAQSWGERPVVVWAVNYPGYGGSTGPATLPRVAQASAAAHDALRQVAGERALFVQGSSLGSAVALHVAAHAQQTGRPITGMILHNPPPLRQIILRQFGWWNLWLLAGPVALQVPGELDAIANARRITAPAVFLLAEHDEIVLPKYQRMVASAYAGTNREVPMRGAFHNSPMDAESQEQYTREIDWLWEECGLQKSKKAAKR